MTNAVYEVRNLSKRFGPVTALEDVSLSLRRNEVVGLIGQNGSGKSTLMKTMAGVQRPDTGNMVLRGQAVSFRSTVDAAKSGVGLVHQEQSLIPNLTVAENIFIDKSASYVRSGWYRWRELLNAARRQLDKIELDIRPDTPVEKLSFGQRQMVELAKVLALEEMMEEDLVIMFDEPTSMLTSREIDDLFKQINRIRSRASIVFISHRMDEVLTLSDRVYVMSDGRRVAERERGQVDADELYELMVGKQRSTATREDEMPRSSKPRLVLDRARFNRDVGPFSITVNEGEILGLIGVQRSGAEVLCRGLFGIDEVTDGEIVLDGKPFRPTSPRGAVHRGVGYLPAERKKEGMLTGMSVLENMTLSFGFDFGFGGFIANRAKEHAVASDWARRLKVKTPSLHADISKLSGGNQQKAVLGKWLMGKNLKLLLLDHPTRGLDPGARSDLFETMRHLAREGLSIVFVADTLDEVLLLSDTVAVMKDGQFSDVFRDISRNRPAEEQIVRAMV
ncbi:sugar ABC transporter ATP-binding protein [Paraburkholderia sp. J41]|uniref:sugar ABC transporter ATP-binding protein n=1 Tax=Paraburkholderia sp. J41 TaxID=2805433 RepID=UPI002AC3443A|nr:sugar ABC transporter ATP-binding protein [Paraburkholderia sp. J41]